MTLEEWLGTDNQIGIDIWHRKYQRNNETFDEWIDRVSGKDSEVKQLILDKKFLPGGRILYNRGIQDEKCSLSNCYVISPPKDNIESIYKTCAKLARTYSYGGGCGIDISNLAPTGAQVHNQAKATSGAVSFMDTFSQVTEQIGQNGRRGALMISISDTHPDLEKFITVKSDLTKVNFANISVRISDAFMNAVKEDSDWELKYERKETGEVISKTVKAKEIFHKICEQNWNYAEPGMLFWDRIKNYNLLSNTKNFKYGGVNPCAEEPLPAGGSCNLGALNLSAFVKDDKFDFNEFGRAVEVAVRCQNAILEEGLNRHPLKEQKDSVERYKQIGVGIMGLADMLIRLKIKYGSKQAVDLCDKIGTYLNYYGMKATNKIGSNKGCYKDFSSKKVLSTPYFIYQDKCFADYNLNQSFTSNYCPRNSQLFTIAPTGSISTMLGVSGGIEPIFANYYERTTKSLHGKDVKYKLYTPIVKEYMDKNHLKDDEELPFYFTTSAEIPVNERIEMQAVWQSHIDASISSTVNLPNSATVEDVEEIYMYAWKMGLKGVTVYRADCAREGILNVEKPKEEKPKEKIKSNIIKEDKLQRGDILCVSDDLLSMKRTIVNGCGKFYIHVDFDEYSGEPLETFIDIGSGGGCERNLEFISRLMSLALRAGVPLSEIIEQANSIKPCNAYIGRTLKKGDTSKGTSCPSAIGNALKELQEKINKRCFVEEEIEETVSCTGKCTNCSECASLSEKISNTHARCPECGEPLIFEGGCNVCKNCGWSKCG